MCAYHCTKLLYTTQTQKVFPHDLQIIIPARCCLVDEREAVSQEISAKIENRRSLNVHFGTPNYCNLTDY